MEKIEKVIKGIEKCIAVPGMCRGCPYEKCDAVGRQLRDCSTDVLRDALELLKAQQPIRPTSYCVLDKNGRTSLRWKCGRCGRLIKYNKGVIKGKDYESIDFYCGNCGTPILWNNKNCSF